MYTLQNPCLFQWKQNNVKVADIDKSEIISQDYQTVQEVLPRPPAIFRYEEISVNAEEDRTWGLSETTEFYDMQAKLTRVKTDSEGRFWIRLYAVEIVFLFIFLLCILLSMRLFNTKLHRVILRKSQFKNQL